MQINTPLTLPRGAILRKRICKAAMTNKRVLTSFIRHTSNEIKINKRREVNQVKNA